MTPVIVTDIHFTYGKEILTILEHDLNGTEKEYSAIDSSTGVQ